MLRSESTSARERAAGPGTQGRHQSVQVRAGLRTPTPRTHPSPPQTDYPAPHAAAVPAHREPVPMLSDLRAECVETLRQLGEQVARAQLG
jgi:hypothetical protein